uniref:Uncharacterized protein n=1 Tax=Chromera velia CCMP2878 TaxID=1169474 RepID=A0A0G4GCJ5_9ALVE|eukprot:Cvel_21293.t1-p1 / transcript=Cvel_21293.t1 / gene=Cvel_21293 / organism=Chromera_velia_CCMP2878 / gene_product=hypothetical protein / transcript_product=hypothetical protein / location=Cvel_scaffold1983:15940-30931(+) / protein_length=2334 / sequence_SO=supercontig / SO=protein_coding / is_pseudo=false
MNRDPEAHIRELRERRRMSDENAARQARSIKLLSDELYSSKDSFFRELVQNAEDAHNKYPPATGSAPAPAPAIRFLYVEDPSGGLRVLKDGRTRQFDSVGAALVVVSNEIGFSWKDVEAICDVGASQKVGRESLEEGEGQTIGEKGIGFKSVFKITEDPHVISRGYSFKLSSNDDPEMKYGYIVPQWVPHNDLPEVVKEHTRGDGGSVFYLPLHKDAAPSVQSDLRTCGSEVLLFLKKLSRIEISYERRGAGGRVIEKMGRTLRKGSKPMGEKPPQPTDSLTLLQLEQSVMHPVGVGSGLGGQVSSQRSREGGEEQEWTSRFFICLSRPVDVKAIRERRQREGRRWMDTRQSGDSRRFKLNKTTVEVAVTLTDELANHFSTSSVSLTRQSLSSSSGSSRSGGGSSRWDQRGLRGEGEGEGRLVGEVFCGLPTGEETRLPFHVNCPHFLLSTNRESLLQDSGWNSEVASWIAQTALALFDSVSACGKVNPLTRECLMWAPLVYQHSRALYRKIASETLEGLKSRAIVPTHGGHLKRADAPGVGTVPFGFPPSCLPVLRHVSVFTPKFGLEERVFKALGGGVLSPEMLLIVDLRRGPGHQPQQGEQAQHWMERLNDDQMASVYEWIASSEDLKRMIRDQQGRARHVKMLRCDTGQMSVDRAKRQKPRVCLPNPSLRFHLESSSLSRHAVLLRTVILPLSRSRPGEVRVLGKGGSVQKERAKESWNSKAGWGEEEGDEDDFPVAFLKEELVQRLSRNALQWLESDCSVFPLSSANFLEWAIDGLCNAAMTIRVPDQEEHGEERGDAVMMDETVNDHSLSVQPLFGFFDPNLCSLALDLAQFLRAEAGHGLPSNVHKLPLACSFRFSPPQTDTNMQGQGGSGQHSKRLPIFLDAFPSARGQAMQLMAKGVKFLSAFSSSSADFYPFLFVPSALTLPAAPATQREREKESLDSLAKRRLLSTPVCQPLPRPPVCRDWIFTLLPALAEEGTFAELDEGYADTAEGGGGSLLEFLKRAGAGGRTQGGSGQQQTQRPQILCSRVPPLCGGLPPWLVSEGGSESDRTMAALFFLVVEGARLQDLLSCGSAGSQVESGLIERSSQETRSLIRTQMISRHWASALIQKAWVPCRGDDGGAGVQFFPPSRCFLDSLSGDTAFLGRSSLFHPVDKYLLSGFPDEGAFSAVTALVGSDGGLRRATLSAVLKELGVVCELTVPRAIQCIRQLKSEAEKSSGGSASSSPGGAPIANAMWVDGDIVGCLIDILEWLGKMEWTGGEREARQGQGGVQRGWSEGSNPATARGGGKDLWRQQSGDSVSSSRVLSVGDLEVFFTENLLFFPLGLGNQKEIRAGRAGRTGTWMPLPRLGCWEDPLGDMKGCPVFVASVVVDPHLRPRLQSFFSRLLCPLPGAAHYAKSWLARQGKYAEILTRGDPATVSVAFEDTKRFLQSAFRILTKSVEESSWRAFSRDPNSRNTPTWAAEFLQKALVFDRNGAGFMGRHETFLLDSGLRALFAGTPLPEPFCPSEYAEEFLQDALKVRKLSQVLDAQDCVLKGPPYATARASLHGGLVTSETLAVLVAVLREKHRQVVIGATSGGKENGAERGTSVELSETLQNFVRVRVGFCEAMQMVYTIDGKTIPLPLPKASVAVVVSRQHRSGATRGGGSANALQLDVVEQSSAYVEIGGGQLPVTRQSLETYVAPEVTSPLLIISESVSTAAAVLEVASALAALLPSPLDATARDKLPLLLGASSNLEIFAGREGVDLSSQSFARILSTVKELRGEQYVPAGLPVGNAEVTVTEISDDERPMADVSFAPPPARSTNPVLPSGAPRGQSDEDMPMHTHGGDAGSYPNFPHNANPNSRAAASVSAGVAGAFPASFGDGARHPGPPLQNSFGRAVSGSSPQSATGKSKRHHALKAGKAAPFKQKGPFHQPTRERSSGSAPSPPSASTGSVPHMPPKGAGGSPQAKGRSRLDIAGVDGAQRLKEQGLSEDKIKAIGRWGEAFGFNKALRNVLETDASFVRWIEPSEDRALGSRFGFCASRFALLSNAFPDGDLEGGLSTVVCSWINANDETGLPFDMVVERFDRDGKAIETLLEIEVKMTVRKLFHFRLSGNEVRHAKDNPAQFRVLLVRMLPGPVVDWVLVDNVYDRLVQGADIAVKAYDCLFASHGKAVRKGQTGREGTAPAASPRQPSTGAAAASNGPLATSKAPASRRPSGSTPTAASARPPAAAAAASASGRQPTAATAQSSAERQSADAEVKKDMWVGGRAAPGVLDLRGSAGRLWSDEVTGGALPVEAGAAGCFFDIIDLTKEDVEMVVQGAEEEEEGDWMEDVMDWEGEEDEWG